MRSRFRGCLRALTLTVLSSLFLPAAICSGQTRPGDMLADVPFPFMVDDNWLPPGHYLVTSIDESTLRISNRRNGVIFRTHSVLGTALDGNGKMMFKRYGDRYLLTELWIPASNRGKQLYPSKTEKIARRTKVAMARLEIKSY